MDQFLFQELKERERTSHLEAISEGEEEQEYSVFLTPDELAERKDNLSRLVITESGIADRKKVMLEELKAELAPVLSELKAVLTEIKSGTIRTKGVVFKVLDEPNNQVGFYNSRGQLVMQRAMLQSDRQLTIKAVNY
jgi:hypothetical protein